jgi:DUF4097 and DUF4098 domain-containing protein YvlB
MIHRFMLAVALAAATALPASAQQKDKDRDRHRDRDRDRDGDYTSTVDTVLPLSRNGAVDVHLMSGNINVTGWTRNEVRVYGTTERGEIRVEGTASRVEIGDRTPRGRRGDTELEITVPEGTRLTINGHSTDVSVRGVKGEVEIATTNGDLIIDNATSRVAFESVSGDVQVSRVQGELRGEAMSGEVDVTDVSGDVEVETVSGDLTLRNVRSKYVRAESVSGSVEFEGRTEPQGRYDFASHSGDVRLILPAALGATISVETFSGTIDSDFPIVLQPGDRHGKQFQFQVGDGGARIDATSFSGGIYIQRGMGRDRE